MPYVGKDFPDAGQTEAKWYPFDFQDDMSYPAEQIMPTPVCTVSVKDDSPLPDASAASRKLDGPSVTGTVVVALVGNLLPGVVYKIQIDVITSTGQELSYWSYVECVG